MPLHIDTSKTGLEMFFKPWQIQALDHLYIIHPQGANCAAVHKVVNGKTKISRTSVFNFLNYCVNEGLMTYDLTTGRGGSHRIYTLTITEKDLLEHLTEETLRFLMKEFPEATKQVMPDMISMMKKWSR
jgi:hypothetical protein